MKFGLYIEGDFDDMLALASMVAYQPGEVDEPSDEVSDDYDPSGEAGDENCNGDWMDESMEPVEPVESAELDTTELPPIGRVEEEEPLPVLVTESAESESDDDAS